MARPRPALSLPENIHTLPIPDALKIICDKADGRALVSFSGGKDAVGCVLALKAAGFTNIENF